MYAAACGADLAAAASRTGGAGGRAKAGAGKRPATTVACPIKIRTRND